MTPDIKEWIATGRKYADAIDKDRGFESGVTDCLRGLSDALEAMAGEVERLKAQVRFASETDPAMRAEAAEAERDRLKAALEPFARFAKMFDTARALPRSDFPTNGEWYVRDDSAGRHVLTVEMFDEARKALGGDE